MLFRKSTIKVLLTALVLFQIISIPLNLKFVPRFIAENVVEHLVLPYEPATTWWSSQKTETAETDYRDLSQIFQLELSVFEKVNQNSVGKTSESIEGITKVAANRLRSVKRNSTLALLFPPGLVDGYRNQVMRFIAFVAQAKQRGLTQIFLPSLLWSTQLHNIEEEVHGSPIPMEWVFDIDYWNSFSEHLPVIVSELPESDCWASAEETTASVYWPSNSSDLNALQKAALARGAFRNVMNTTVGYITKSLPEMNPRQIDVLADVEHCREPQGYGGGTFAGHLWNDYLMFMEKPGLNDSIAPYQVDKWVLRALQPARQWRDVARQCVDANTPESDGNYLALHARVELDMLAHTYCSQHMEHNLTKILQLVEGLAGNMTDKVNSAFMAVSRYGLEIKNWKYDKFKQTADDNLQTYYRVTGYNQTKRPDSGIGSATFPVFQCGEPALKKFYEEHSGVPDHGYLLHSVIDFYIAVNAFAFVGPAWGSTFTRDVWITRYHLGKGEHNYQYTKDGLEKVGNGGLPDLHSFC